MSVSFAGRPYCRTIISTGVLVDLIPAALDYTYTLISKCPGAHLGGELPCVAASGKTLSCFHYHEAGELHSVRSF